MAKFRDINDFLILNKDEIIEFKKLSVEAANFIKERGFAVNYRIITEIKRNPKSELLENVREISIQNLEEKIYNLSKILDEKNDKIKVVLLLIENELTLSLNFNREEMAKYSINIIRLIKLKRALILNLHKRLNFEENPLSIFLNSSVEAPHLIDQMFLNLENILESTNINTYYFLKSLLIDKKHISHLNFR